MKRIPVRAAAVLAVALSCSASAGDPDIPLLKAYEQPAYTLVTHDEYTASEIPGQTERIDAFLRQQLAMPEQAASMPTKILVLPYNLAHRYFEIADDRLTDFVPARFANFLMLEHSINSNIVRNRLFHQYTHAYLRSQMKRYYPLWFDEGMAMIVAFTRFYDTKAEIGMPVLASTPWIPVARLFQLDRSSPEYLSENQAFGVHYGSWALVHLAFIEDPAFNKQLFDFLAALNNLHPIDKAMEKSFGVSADELDLRMRRYIQKVSLDAFFEVKLPRVARPKVPRGRDMSEAESLVLLAETMLAAGTRPERLGELIEAAYRKTPDSPKVLVLRMQLAVRDRDDDALARLQAESEPRASDPQVARAVGLALFERVRETRSGDTMSPADRERMSRRAFELLDRAVMSRPDDIEAIWGYAMLAARLKQDLATAMRRVDSGLAIASHNADLAMAAALIYEAQGEEKKMIPFLVVTARMSKLTDQREWAIKRVNAVLASQAGAPTPTPSATK